MLTVVGDGAVFPFPHFTLRSANNGFWNSYGNEFQTNGPVLKNELGIVFKEKEVILSGAATSYIVLLNR